MLHCERFVAHIVNEDGLIQKFPHSLITEKYAYPLKNLKNMAYHITTMRYNIFDLLPLNDKSYHQLINHLICNIKNRLPFVGTTNALLSKNDTHDGVSSVNNDKNIGDDFEYHRILSTTSK
jgi:hypothetical protein